MKQQYISLYQFLKCFPDWAAAVRLYEKACWPNVVRCLRCDSVERMKSAPNSESHPHHCSACRKNFNVRVESVTQTAHIPLQQSLAATYFMMMARKGVSSCQIVRKLDNTHTMKPMERLAHLVCITVHEQDTNAELIR